MYYYEIYGMSIRCNVRMPHLTELYNLYDYDVDLTIVYDDLPPKSFIRISDIASVPAN